MTVKETLGLAASSWERFLNSLATRGGNILVLLILWLVMGMLVYHVLHHAEINGEAKTVVLTTFSGFTGALIAVLQGGQSRQRGGDVGEASKLAFSGEARLV